MSNERDFRQDRRRGGRRYGPTRRRTCPFCADKNLQIDYKRVEMLRDHVTDRGKIQARRKTGLCARHQRRMTIAIKRARHMALLPFIVESMRRG